MATPAPVKNNPASLSQGLSGSARVTLPDQNGSFHLNVPRTAVTHVQVVDVDMVLQLSDGTKLVLAGGAMEAMDARSRVMFTDASPETGSIFDLVGKIPLQNHDQSLILNSDPNNTHDRSADGDGLVDNHFTSNNNSAQVNPAATSMLAKIIQDNAGSLTSNGLQNLALPSVPVPPAPPVTTGADSLIKQISNELPERPGSVLTPIVVGPQTPAMTLNLLNLTTQTQVGSVLFGSGGSPASATDGSNPVQFAPQVIRAGDDVHTIYATGSTNQNDFIKIFKIDITGDGTVSSIMITGVPPTMKILNAIDHGGGNYEIIPEPGQKTFDVQVQYSTGPADPSEPTPPTSTINFDTTVITTDGATHLTDSRVVVIKDADSYTDLTYLDPATGKSVWVLPAQGVPHEVHAGDGGVTIYGSNANDLLYGGAGADTIIGGSGNTYFEGGGGADVLTGGATGVNTAGYKNSGAGVTIDLNTGLGSGGDAQGDVLSHIQNVIGSAFDDTIVANSAVNRLDGGSGGSDTVSYAASGAGVTVNLIAGTGSNGDAEGDTYVHIQNAIGSAHDDVFIANTLVNHLDGGSGGSDSVSYAASTAGVTVNLSTGTGSGGSAQGDTYVHIQNVTGSAFNDVFVANGDVNNFDGGSGLDTVSYAASSAGVSVNLVSGRGVGGDAEGDSYAHIQNVIGSAYDDVFVAGIDSRTFDGGAGGSDTVNYGASTGGIVANMVTMTGSGGYAQNNTYINIANITGSSSNDIFISGAAGNHFDGGSGGSDTVSYAFSDAGVTVNLFDGSASGGYAENDSLLHIQNIIGSDHDDFFIASADNNRFDGGAGVNTVSYENSVGGVTIDLTNSIGTGTGSTYANGDSFVNIQNLVGSIYDDIFVASADANKLDGGDSTSGSHNRVSYEDSDTGVTVDLNYTDGTGTSGGYAQGDKLINIQDLTGSASDDTFVANAAHNNFDGGAGSNTISYAASDAGVTVDLVLGGGAGGYATGDTYLNIQNVIGSGQNDVFIANAAANNFDGLAGNNTVSYAKASDSNGVLVDLVNGLGSNGFAAGDKYANIQNVIGTTNDDTIIASSVANVFDGQLGSDTVSYAYSGAGVTVNLVTGTGTGGFAEGDTYTSIENVTGSASDDLFVASADANTLDGGTSDASSHNRVSYAESDAGVTVDLSKTDGTGTSGGYAQGDKLSNIQDLTGSRFDDTFIATEAVNYLDGGVSTSGSHNRVSYVNSTVAETIDLFAGQGSGGAGSLANGDTYANIQDATGGSGDDTFVASADSNRFDGGSSTAASHNRVSYVHSAAAVTVDVYKGAGTGGLADGDTYTDIQDVTGGAGDDTFVASAAANNFNGDGGNHNRVSYINSAAAVTVDLYNGVGTGGLADGDKYTGIQDATGGSGDDLFIASADNNRFDGGGGNHNRVDYTNSTAAVTVDLYNGAGTGGLADGDTYAGIQDATGGAGDDLFIASADNNRFDGGGSNHNRVDYTNSAAAVTVDLYNGTGTGGLADGDTYIRIQDATGGAGDDNFIASADNNRFDGGGSNHNRVDYTNSAAAVTVDLYNGTGTGGLADGDTYTNIQDATGGAGDDNFIASADNNRFDGAGSNHNRVDYTNSAAAVTVDLYNGTGTGGLADGDTYTNIQDATGGAGDDTFFASADNNRFDGAGSNHNRVNYTNSVAAVTVDLYNGTGTGGLADGDTYINIQDATGGAGDDIFIASADNNRFDGAGSDHNRVDYTNSAAAVTVDLFNGAGTGGLADGDTYVNIQDATGGAGDDIFIASGAANKFDGDGSNHNRVDYTNSAAAVTVDLYNGTGTGGLADGDTYTNIQDATGGAGDDIFIASGAANKFDGSGGNHNLVSYANSNVAETVDLFLGTGGGGVGSLAAGDTYTNIQDVTGGSADDTFIASGDRNRFDGGGGSHNRVSYANSTAAVTVDLFGGNGTGGLAQGDKYTHIQDVTGGSGDDTFIANSDNNNFDGGSGSDTVSYASATTPVTVNLSTGGGAGSGGFAQGDTYTSIENVIGGSGNDTLTGASTGKTVLTGGVGHDMLSGVAGNHGNTWASYASSANGVTVDLNHTDGAGTFGGDADGDHLSLIDNLLGSSKDDTFIANNVVNSFDGGNGSDTVSYISSDAGVTVDLSGGAAGIGGYAQDDTYANMENVIGSNLADVLTGANAGKTTLTGLDGGDMLSGTAANHGNTYASYAGSGSGVTVDLNFTDGTGTFGGAADGDHLNLIDNLIGSSYDDTFIASNQHNNFNGGASGSDTVSYLASTAGVTVDLSVTDGSGTSGGFATGDQFSGISNLIGSNFDDTFFASSAANAFDGSGHTLNGDTVSYARSNVGVLVDLYHHTGGDATTAVSFAHGDTYANIQNVTGSGGDDIFVADGNVNRFDGGNGSDTVSYEYAQSGSGDIVANLLSGKGTSGDANGDTYTRVENLTGSANVDSTLTGDGNANTLTALGDATTNILTGGGASSGTDVLDGREGGHNTLTAGSGNNTFMVSAHNSDTIVNATTGTANLVEANGSGGVTTLHFDDLGRSLDVSKFAGTAHGITTLDITSSNNTNILIGAADVQHLGVNNVLTIKLTGEDSIQIQSDGSEHYRVFANGDYVFYNDSTFSTEIARIHIALG